jgi:hypothetical protein
VYVKYVGYKIRVFFLCYSYHAFSYIPYFSQQNAPNKIRHKTHLILGNNLYMFQHRGVIFRELINNKGLLSPTGTSNDSRPHFRHHVEYCPLYTLTWYYVVCLSQMRSLWITHFHRCLYTQPRKYIQLPICNRRGLLLYVVVMSAIWTCAS